jgi:outer membrane receptor protein involved in Fe transport
MKGIALEKLFPQRIFIAGLAFLRGALCVISTVFSTMAVIAVPAPAEEKILEEVVVVAQKRPQNLQDVPVAVTAFSGDELVISGIEDVFDLSNMAPALQIRQTVQSRSTTFRIRGVGTLGNNFGLESSVGLYVDGVYRSRQGSMINNMLDIDSIEVLRGPQGTLFGRNTLAGAVLLNTVAPTHDGRDGFADVTIGNYNLMTVSGATSLSAIEDVLALRASAFSSQRDGYVDDIHFGDNEIYDRDRWGARLQAVYTPNNALSVRFITDYSERRETCCAALVVNDNLRPVALPEGATSYAGTDEVARSLGATVFTKDQYYDHKTALNSLPRSDDEDGGATLTLSWDLAPITVTSITGYRRFEAHYAFDSDHSDLMLTAEFASEEQSAWSQELRINKDGEKISYVAGLYYFNQDLDTVSLTQFGRDANALWSHLFFWYPETRGQFPLGDISSFPLPAVPLFVPDSGARNIMKQDHAAYAVFGQADYYLMNDLMLTAGLRYTREEKDLSGKFTQGSSPDFTDNRIAIDFVQENFPPVAPRDPIEESLSDDQVTGTLKLSWFYSLDAMVYASFATGYKSGGTNTDRIDPELDYIFDPETSEAFEVGWKASFPAQALRVNLALHKTDIDDLQVNYADDNLFVLQNAGKLDSYGGELEVTWLPSDSLTLTAAYSRTEGEFKDFQDSFCWIAYPFHTGRPDPGDPSGGENPVACDRSGEDLHENPEFLFASAKQAYAVSDGIGGFILAEYSYLGKSESVRHDPYQTASSYDLLNLRLGFEFERYDAVVTVWGRNILDEEYRMTGGDAASTPGKVIATSGEPATYGVTVRIRF